MQHDKVQTQAIREKVAADLLIARVHELLETLRDGGGSRRDRAELQVELTGIARGLFAFGKDRWAIQRLREGHEWVEEDLEDLWEAFKNAKEDIDCGVEDEIAAKALMEKLASDAKEVAQ